MKDIIFIYPPYCDRPLDGNMFSLGIGYLISGILKKHYTFDYINCQTLRQSDPDTFIERLAVELAREQYLLIAISSVTSDAIPFLKEIIDASRKAHPDTPVIIGGQLVSVDYAGKQLMQRFDIDGISRGEGDNVTPELIAYLRAGNKFEDFEGITTRTHEGPIHRIQNIDKLPFPYRTPDLISENKLSYRRSTIGSSPVPMITSRGCPYACNYCVSGCNCTGRNFRKRSWDNIVAEIKYLQTEFGVYNIGFYDDCFFWNKHTVNEDIDEFEKQLHLHHCEPFIWQMEIRADIMFEIRPEYWKKLSDLGCWQVNVGVESCYEDSLQYLGKNLHTDIIEQAFENLWKYAPEIISWSTFIVAGPNSEPEDIYGLADFGKKLHMSYIQICPLVLYPGTRSYESVFGKSDIWLDVLLDPGNPDPYQWAEQDAEKLIRTKAAINETYRRFYLSDYWEQKASMHYAGRYEEVRNNIRKRFGVDV